MRDVTAEEGVVKLVHPGRHVEIHKEPITAAEVMKKNPRHCITRPDVFKYPWIVVRPESVLTPGRVYLIVPNSTIHRLLRDSEQAYGDSPFLCQNQSPRQTSWLKSWVGMTPRHQNQDHETSCLLPYFKIRTRKEMSPQRPKYAEKATNQSQMSPGVRLQLNTREPIKKIATKTQPEPSIEIMSSLSKYNHSNAIISRNTFPKTASDNPETKSCKQFVRMKSCLRKQDSIRRSQDLRVTFLLPNEDHKLDKSINACGRNDMWS